MARHNDRHATPEADTAPEYEALEYVFTVRGTVQVGGRTYELPLQVTVDTDTLAAVVQQHLEEGTDLRAALLEAYARSFQPSSPPSREEDGDSSGRKPSQADRIAAMTLEELR